MQTNLTTRKRHLVNSAMAFALTVFAGTRHAHAEDVDTQRFVPRATTGGYFVTEGTDLRNTLDPFSLGLWLSYARNPLISLQDGEVTEHIIKHQVAFDLTTSYAFSSWFELGAHVPLAYLSGDDLSEGAIGDVRLLPKFRLLEDQKAPVGLALLADTRLPTHTSAFYGGARLPAFAPRLLLDHRFGLSGFRAGLDVGALLRKHTEYRNVDAASEIQAGVAMGYRFDGGQSPVELKLDLRSAVGLKDPNAEEVALEGLLGAGVDVSRDWKVDASAGLGLLEGFGVPTMRALVGLRWEPSPNDADHDGLRNPEPSEREETLVAPEEPESEGAAKPEDGSGKESSEPSEGSATTAAEEEEPASVDDVDDAAREQAIRGGYDACPDLPEDLDGIEDEDGCPEGDVDRDGVLDYQDRCPDEAETINGYKDDDGCEDEGPAQIVIEDGRLVILETIKFEPSSSKIERGSRGILDQIALTLRKHDEIRGLEIGGHTDSTGPRGYNLRLSRERARSVRLYLLERGIKPQRIHARGFGPDKPIADNETDDGKALNRRVEFLLVQ